MVNPTKAPNYKVRKRGRNRDRMNTGTVSSTKEVPDILERPKRPMRGRYGGGACISGVALTSPNVCCCLFG